MKKKNSKSSGKLGFTLIELLVAMSILSILLLLLSQLLDQVQKTWNYSEGRVSQFREARVAFDIITKNLSQASLNTYWDYEYKNNLVYRYKRQSELHFLTLDGKQLSRDAGRNGGVDGDVVGKAIFFQAPLGVSNVYRNLNNLFVARGYYLVFGNDDRFKPSIIDSAETNRFRLMEYRPPAELNQIYIDGDEERKDGRAPVYDKWYCYEMPKYSTPLAENIVGFVVAPRDTLINAGEARRNTFSRIASDYNFDSNEHTDPRFVQQVPPLVQVTLVAIDEASAIRLEAENQDVMPDLGIDRLFFNTGQFDEDVEKLEEELSGRNISHRVFSTLVSIRSSKWSTYVPSAPN
ncbi:MAG: Verru_Chthon cassette protein C [Verrucomicrobiae bacterium]|nr:Verru_Chthon cassette protein C [Verrucomicrobiae bacterium]